jgi:hypothetical protein
MCILNQSMHFLSLFLIITLLISLSGCSSSQEGSLDKMDTALRQKLSKVEKENPDELIQFIGKSSSEISPAVNVDISSTGVQTESIIGNIFTASGNAESIKKLSLKDFITSLELVRTQEIK